VTAARERRRTAGLVAFTVLCLLGSWSVAATLRVFDVNLAQRRLGTQLFALSMHYLATMGWQPVVATWFVQRYVDREASDLAVRSCPSRFSVIGATTAFAFTAIAAALAFAAAKVGVVAPSTVNGLAEPARAESVRSWFDVVAIVVGSLVGLLFVWMQAAAEEIGWRGYLLPTAMRRFGRWRGLVFQGAVWGLWYAPVLFFSTYGRLAGADSILRCITFSISCVLLGVLLGWLRLASGSVVPVVTANVTLTLIAGVPYVLHGIDAGLRSAIFQPVGWLVLMGAVIALSLSRFRSAVRVPADPSAEQPAIALRQLFIVFVNRRDRTLN
jgi:membrane protease YdiL (CAAX protease family)